ncbi:MAG: LppX_LprAFG lipoprotein [Chloroflexi bacterium]|nr:LppX_LprAFG lipoprotein [Chloroflexota bacterium]
MEKLRSFHFRLEVANGVMPLGAGFVATSVEGDAAAPDRLKMTVKARLANTPVELQVIAIGSRRYLTNPLTRRWQDVSGNLVTPALLDPERGIGGVLRRLENPERLGRESLEGVETWRLRGAVPAAVLVGMVGGQAAGAEPIGLEVWVGAGDWLVRQVKLAGAVTQGEAPQMERTLKLSSFNQSVSIDAP